MPSELAKEQPCCTGFVPGATVRGVPTLSDSGRCLATFQRANGGMSLPMFWRWFSAKHLNLFLRLPKNWFYSTSRPSNRGFGLNVMPPLLQVLCLNPAQKAVWNIPVSNSTDPEIRLWLEVKDKESKGGEWYELLTREDYAKAVVRAGPEDIAAKWAASTQSIVVPSDRGTFDSSMLRVCSLMSHENLESVRPTGSFSAKIGFVSGYLSIEEARSETQGLAWGVTTMQSSGHGV